MSEIRSRSDGNLIIVDPKEERELERFAKYTGVNVIIPNSRELRQSCLGMRLSRDVKYDDVKEILVSRKFDYLLCTAGEDGVFDYDRNGVTHLEGRGVQVADVAGASDTFVAIFSLAFVNTGDIILSARVAESGARIKVTKRLTATVTAI